MNLLLSLVLAVSFCFGVFAQDVSDDMMATDNADMSNNSMMYQDDMSGNDQMMDEASPGSEVMQDDDNMTDVSDNAAADDNDLYGNDTMPASDNDAPGDDNSY